LLFRCAHQIISCALAVPCALGRKTEARH
jgi:hypothetical protein